MTYYFSNYVRTHDNSSNSVLPFSKYSNTVEYDKSSKHSGSIV